MEANNLFDFKFDWDEKMNTGIDVIDSQHKELFKIARDIEQLVLIHCNGVNNEYLMNIINRLRDYVSYHFYQEEKLMEQYKYSKFKEHKSIHDNFQKKVTNIDCVHLMEQPYEVLSKVKDLLQDWVFGHLIVEDARMANEIKERMND